MSATLLPDRPSTVPPTNRSERTVLAIAGLVLLLSLMPRFVDIGHFLPAYAMDENDVVEPAIGFLGGDLDPKMYRYGSLHAYGLAVVFWLQAVVSPLDVSSFARTVFFEPTSLFLTARWISSCLNILLAWLTYLLARRIFDRRVAALAAVLAVFPFFDLLVNFKVRIDTVLALCTTATVLAAVTLAENGRHRDAVRTGVFFGLGLAAKPLPGLLSLPTIALAHWVGQATKDREAKEHTSTLGALATTLRHPGLYLSLVVGLVTFLLGHPYALLRFAHFRDVQIHMIRTDGGRAFEPGWNPAKFLDQLGLPFVVIAGLAILYMTFLAVRHRRGTLLVLASYPIVFWLAFAPGAARRYFYVPLLPIAIVALAKLIDDLAIRIGRRSNRAYLAIAGSMVAVLVAQPTARLVEQTQRLHDTEDPRARHTALDARQWIESTLPNRARVLLVGYYTNLPRLVDARRDVHFVLGEYFMYDRHENRFLVEQFERAHDHYLARGEPVFTLETTAEYDPAHVSLPAFCRQRQIEYVVSAFDLSTRLGFEDTLLRRFDRTSHRFGPPVWVYKVPGEDRTTE